MRFQLRNRNFRRADTVKDLGTRLDAVGQGLDHLQPACRCRVSLLRQIAVRECVLVRVKKHFCRALDAGLSPELAAFERLQCAVHFGQKHIPMFVDQV